jgi:hypothetical protein
MPSAVSKSTLSAGESLNFRVTVMRALFLASVLCGLVAGCSEVSLPDDVLAASAHAATTSAPRLRSAVAADLDHGALFRYSPSATRKQGASTWHEVQLSEAHALRAIADGSMQVDLPDGRRMQLRYERHVEHPDGNWTWIGRLPGTGSQAAVLTFGQKAVFGSLPSAEGEPLQLTTVGGHTWLVEGAMPDAAGDGLADALPAPDARSTTATMLSSTVPASAALATTASVVDVVVGYTKGLADTLGGRSQVLTRLNNVVAIANQAYVDSQVDLTMVLAGAVEVDYPDATTNRSALFQLTGVECVGRVGSELPDGGVSCIPARIPKNLQPLVGLRNSKGADLMVLMRALVDPGVQSCGTAWLLGGGQQPISTGDAAFGVSVVSDTSAGPVGGNSCRSEWLAHETGHNFGLQHDVTAAQGSDDSNNDGGLLDPEEYGAFPYSFGYSTDTIATIMSVRQGSQIAYRVFANPNVTLCGGAPCGVAGQSDNALSMSQTMPVIAAFRSPPVLIPPCTKNCG